MVSRRTAERPEAVDGPGEEAATAMTRRSVLAAGAGAIPGLLSNAHRRTTSVVGAPRRRPQDGEWVETARLTAADAAPGARFGYSIAIEGNRALVGADADSENGVDAGAAYVFEFEGDRWVQTQKLTADGGAPDDRFGDAVALDEGRALVGARRSDSRGPDAGAAYVFEKEGDRWVQTQKLTAADAGRGDRFGDAVALGGDRLLVGAGRDDESAEDAGAVYTFGFEGGRWSQTQKIAPDSADIGTRFGSTLTRERNTALVGAEHDNERGDDAGAVFAFQLARNRWRRTQKLTAEDAGPKDRFGSAVSLGGDRALVGAMNADAAADKGGAAYVFAREDADGAAGATGRGFPFVSPRTALLTLGGVAAVIATVVLVFGRGLSRLVSPLQSTSAEPSTELLSDEERVFELLEDNGGRVKQRDVEDELGWSQTKTSNVVNDLRDDGKIEVYRIGNENTLALPGEMDV